MDTPWLAWIHLLGNMPFTPDVLRLFVVYMDSVDMVRSATFFENNWAQGKRNRCLFDKKATAR